jgi:hypothetical protein
VRPLAAPQEHPTLQWLPADVCIRQLYKHGGTRDHLSSLGWLDSDKLHRTLGGRLAQQVAKVITCDTEYCFGLSERVATSPTRPEVRVNDRGPTLKRTKSKMEC